jgi:hypothetical protein
MVSSIVSQMTALEQLSESKQSQCHGLHIYLLHFQMKQMITLYILVYHTV